jgi:ABC-type sulfate/molybdate transport systems ATPase subunit
VLIDGSDVGGSAQNRRIGFVFQHYHHAAFTHERACATTYRLRRAADPQTTKTQVREKVDELLDLVGLKQVVGPAPGSTRSGQRQRIASARALGESEPEDPAARPSRSTARSSAVVRTRSCGRGWRLHDERGRPPCSSPTRSGGGGECRPDRGDEQGHVMGSRSAHRWRSYDTPASEFVMSFTSVRQPKPTAAGSMRPHDVTISLETSHSRDDRGDGQPGVLG